jgi:hypothetical protein
MTVEYSFEYRVYEQGSPGQSDWWPHGSVHTDRDEALRDLRSKRGTYSRYGRRFKLRRRLLSTWEDVKG